MKKYGTVLFSDPRCQKQLSEINLDRTTSPDKLKIDLLLPNKFDGREVWNNLIDINIDNQSLCMSCWAFAILFSLSSRLSIYTKGKYNLKFSTAKMIFQKNHIKWDNVKQDIKLGIPFDYTTSDKKSIVNACTENTLLEGWQYLYSFGVPEEKCVNDKPKLDNIYPSNILFGDSYDKCPATGEEMQHHRSGGYYYVPGTKSKNINFPVGSEINIRLDIYHWGPCCSAMRIFQDFLDWDGEGIYKWDSVSQQIITAGHAVVIMGWGENEYGIPYWIIRNSWGDKWGKDKGYYKMIRGINNCEIEENVFNGYPTLPSIKLFIEYPTLYRFDDFILRGKWGIQENGYKLTSFEKILQNKITNVNDFNKLIYDVKYWPDFSKLIASDLSTIVFNAATPMSIEKFEQNDDDIIDYIILILFIILAIKYFKKII